LLSISAAKLSFDGDGSGRAGFGGSDWTDKLAARSDVTLNTGRPFAMKLQALGQQGPGQPGSLIKRNYFNGLFDSPEAGRVAAAHPFLPGGKICRFSPCKTGWRDCLTGIRPILENSFSAAKWLPGRERALDGAATA
jgi:hypothetical protein